MGLLSDAVVLARLQFAATAIYHYMFVPLSVGFGMILVILMTKAYRSQDPKDEHLAAFWTKLFAGTFAVGVATGITMEFSFGTNWADYSRFVGDIFGAPLAAEALFAFFMESVFLGVLLFGKNKVGRKFYLASGWLVWIGSCLSCLWIIIANSWMQTPAGYEVVETETGFKAVLTNFFEAAFNPSTLPRYLHVIMALLVTGALVCMAVGAWYKLKNRDQAAKTLIRVGVVSGIITGILLMPAAHMQAKEVAEYQPAKLAAMEGQYETGVSDLSFIGWVDEEAEKIITVSIPGFTSFLATGSFDTVYPGLNDFDEAEVPEFVNAIYQVYHIMVGLIGVIVIALFLGLLVDRGKLKGRKWPLIIMIIGPIAAIVAIQCGWCTAELGRQPWIVYGELLTSDAVSLSVDPWMLVVTLVLFAVVYTLIYVLWLRSFFRTVKAGPEAIEAEAAAAAAEEAEFAELAGELADGNVGQEGQEVQA